MVNTCLQRQRTVCAIELNYFLTFGSRKVTFSAIFSYGLLKSKILKITHHVAISSIKFGTEDHILHPKVNA